MPLARGCRPAQVGLAAALEFQIDLAQKLGVEQAPWSVRLELSMLETPAQRVQAGGSAGELPPRHADGVERPRHRQRLDAEPVQLGIDEPHVEFGIVDNQPQIADEIQELAADLREDRLVPQELLRQPVDREGPGGMSRSGLM